jgi:23S rRNA U2552 (ribose-2'-O)-methylase RlmE/FtsJ
LFIEHEDNLSDKWEQYLPIYEAALQPFLERGDPVRLLEIGVQNGGSLQIWSKYLPAGSTITGIDIDPACADLDIPENVTVWIGDGTDPATLQSLLGDQTFDVIIDDGSHLSEHIIATFKACFHRVVPGGLFIIEDLHASYYPSHGGGFRSTGAAIEWLKGLVDAVNSDHFGAATETAVGYDAADELRLLGRHVQQVSFFDSVAIIRKLPAEKGEPYSRIMTGGTMPVADMRLHLPRMASDELRRVLLTPTAASSLAPALLRAVADNADRAAHHSAVATEWQRQFEEMKQHAEELEGKSDELEAAYVAALEALHRERQERARNSGVVPDVLAGVLRERDEIIRERDELIRERDALRSRLEMIERSTSWRLTHPARRLLSRSGTGRRITRIAAKGTWWLITGQLPQRVSQWKAARAPRQEVVPVESFFQDVPIETFLNGENALTANVQEAHKDLSISLPLGFDAQCSAPGKIAIVLHAFYPDLLPEYLIYLENIPFSSDLYISTTSEKDADAVRSLIPSWRRGRLEIKVVPNRGRDIAPKLVSFANIYDHYEYVLFLHTKKSPHSPVGSEWRQFLLSNVLGSERVVRDIFYLFHRYPKLGMISPQHWDEVRAFVNWGYDYPMAAWLCEKMGVQLSRDMVLDFPSGSMFWARTAALRPLLQVGLTTSDFPEEMGQVDGTLAHAIERLMLTICEHAGYIWLKTARQGLVQHGHTVKEMTSPRQIDKFIRDHGFLATDPASRVPNSIPLRNERANLIRFAPDLETRPRLNLLLPTYRPNSVFGGVATALAIFERIAQACGDELDLRMVLTSDWIELETAEVPSGYQPSMIGDDIDAKKKVVIFPPDLRRKAALPVRANDVFFASAWWDARAAFGLIDQQRRIFGTRHKLVYFVQDFEPNFSAWSSDWALSEHTYRRPADTLALINSIPLAEYLEASGYEFPEQIVFKPLLNGAINPATASGSSRRNVVLVYWRPSVERNLSDLILNAISLWQQKNPYLVGDWEFWGAGEDGPPVRLPNGTHMQALGKLSLKEYEEKLCECKVGLSLMLSPHPSYPPLEMAAFGMSVVVNSFGTKDLSQYGGAFYTVRSLDPDDIADALAGAIRGWSEGAPPASFPPFDMRRAFSSEEDLDRLARDVADRIKAWQLPL